MRIQRHRMEKSALCIEAYEMPQKPYSCIGYTRTQKNISLTHEMCKLNPNDLFGTVCVCVFFCWKMAS